VYTGWRDATRSTSVLALISNTDFLHADRPEVWRLLEQLQAQLQRRETGGDDHKLIFWHQGEAMASLGIGHFLWFPSSVQPTATETFPALIDTLVALRVELPPWLAHRFAIGERGCPWSSRDELKAAEGLPHYQDLMQLLMTTKEQQARFVLDRFSKDLKATLQSLPSEARAQLQARLGALAAASAFSALVDYAHFKGWGTNPSERYQGHGWGLVQVLEQMRCDTLPCFVESAEGVLTERVRLAPPERISFEKAWLPGWLRRVRAYGEEGL
jgi:hypothetical protein